MALVRHLAPSGNLVHMDPVVPLRQSPPMPVRESSLQAKLRTYRRRVEQRSAEQLVGSAYAEEPRMPPRPKGAPRPTPSTALRRLRLREHSGMSTPSDDSSQSSRPQQQRRRAPWVPSGAGAVRPTLPRQPQPSTQAPAPPAVVAIATADGDAEPKVQAGPKPVSPEEDQVPEPMMLIQEESEPLEVQAEAAAAAPPEGQPGLTSPALERWSAEAWARFGAKGARPPAEVARACAKWLALSCNTRRGVFLSQEDLEEACGELGIAEEESAEVAACLWAGLASRQGGAEGRGERIGLPISILLKAVEDYCPDEPAEETSKRQVEELPALDGYWPDPEGGYVPWGDRSMTLSSVGAHMESTESLRSIDDLELPPRATSPPLPTIEVFAQYRRRRPPPRPEERRSAELYTRARVGRVAREIEQKEAAAALAAAELAAAKAAEEARRLLEERARAEALATYLAKEAAAAEMSETLAAEMVASVCARHEASNHARAWLQPLIEEVAEVVDAKREAAKRPRKARLSTTMVHVVKFKSDAGRKSTGRKSTSGSRRESLKFQGQEEEEDETLGGLCRHGHPLQWRPPRGGNCWTCVGRFDPGGCASGFTDEPLSGWLRRFGCMECDTDMCLKCYARTLRWQGLLPPDENSGDTLDRAVSRASRGRDQVEELLGRPPGSIRGSRGQTSMQELYSPSPRGGLRSPSSAGGKTPLLDSGFASEAPSSDRDGELHPDPASPYGTQSGSPSPRSSRPASKLASPTPQQSRAASRTASDAPPLLPWISSEDRGEAASSSTAWKRRSVNSEHVRATSSRATNTFPARELPLRPPTPPRAGSRNGSQASMARGSHARGSLLSWNRWNSEEPSDNVVERRSTDGPVSGSGRTNRLPTVTSMASALGSMGRRMSQHVSMRRRSSRASGSP